MSPSTTSAAFFEEKYLENSDPWNFATSAYELSRYDALLRALGERDYERAFEPACSVGELTARLASRCRRVEGMDISATAIEQARRRCREFSNVELHVGALPDQIPRGDFDLIVFSEIGYYFEEGPLRTLGEQLVHQLQHGGTLLAAHWLGTSTDHVLSGDRVHEILAGLPDLRLELSERHAGFRLDRWGRA